MKKVMLIAVAMMMAIAANAAIVKWSAANIYGPDGTKYIGEVTLFAYLNTATVADAFAVSTVTTTATGAAPATTFNDPLLLPGSSYTFFFTATADGKTFTSASKDMIMQPTGTASILFGNMTTATQAAGAWVSSAVPEPTSGLLLLLGMAGLALKRKVA